MAWFGVAVPTPAAPAGAAINDSLARLPNSQGGLTSVRDRPMSNAATPSDAVAEQVGRAMSHHHEDRARLSKERSVKRHKHDNDGLDFETLLALGAKTRADATLGTTVRTWGYEEERWLDFCLTGRGRFYPNGIPSLFDHLPPAERYGIGTAYCEWLLASKNTRVNKWSSVVKYLSGVKRYHLDQFRGHPLEMDEVPGWREYKRDLESRLTASDDSDKINGIFPFQLFLAMTYSWDVSQPEQALLKALTLFLLVHALRCGDLLPAKVGDWSARWFLTIGSVWFSGEKWLFGVPKTKSRIKGPTLYCLLQRNQHDVCACAATAMESYRLALETHHSKKYSKWDVEEQARRPFFQSWSVRDQCFTDCPICVEDAVRLLDKRIASLYPSMTAELSGAHKYRYSGYNLLLMARVPREMSSFYVDWGQQPKKKSPMENVYDRSLDSGLADVQEALTCKLAEFSPLAWDIVNSMSGSAVLRHMFPLPDESKQPSPSACMMFPPF